MEFVYFQEKNTWDLGIIVYGISTDHRDLVLNLWNEYGGTQNPVIKEK